jgi:hypothetical protein
MALLKAALTPAEGHTMTWSVAAIGLVGGFLALLGTGLQAQASWLRANGGTSVSAVTALRWIGANAGRVLWHVFGFREKRGKGPLPLSSQEAGGVALRFIGAFIAATVLYVALLTDLLNASSA